LLFFASQPIAQAAPPPVRNPRNPPLFRRFAAPPSGWLQFLVSNQGKKYLRRSRTPASVAILKALGEDVSPQSFYRPPEGFASAAPPRIETESATGAGVAQPLSVQSPNAPTPNGCGFDGTVFNLEPATNAVPQFTEAVDFFYNGVASGADLIVGGAGDE